MKTLVIYHKADWDGIFSREICRRWFGDEAEYLGWDYGDPVPVVEAERELVMVDISVEGLMEHPKLIWIDHHKSAIEKFPANSGAYLIDGVAACRLTWQYFFGPNPLPVKEDYVERRVEEPYAVQLVGEYDVWDKRNPEVDTFQHALRAQDLEGQWWGMLLKPGWSKHAVEELMPWGRALEYAAQSANASLAQDAAFELEWEGLTFLALNKPRANSMTFAAAVEPHHDALLAFSWQRDKWRFSLYHVPHRTDLDLSRIAVKHGGGGHRGACGFEVKVLPFELGGDK